MIRHFVLRDLPTLHRYRHRGFFLDTTTALTWGPMVVPAGAFLTHLAPATGIFTYLSVADGKRQGLLLAQLVHHQGSPSARFSFMAPESALDSDAFPDLIEYLANEVGERGAHNLVAEVEESTQAYEILRRNGFAIYARQRVWQLVPDSGAEVESSPWQNYHSGDALAVRLLYNILVPGLTQQVEAPPWAKGRGLTYRRDGDLLAFVSLTTGPSGIMALPFFHPELEELDRLLQKMVARIPNRRSRGIYLNVRSYQGWLESSLESLGAQPGRRQAVMVKRLVAPVQEVATKPIPALKGTTANPTVPITRTPPAPETNGTMAVDHTS